MALCLLYYYRMCDAGMTSTKASLSADIDQLLSRFHQTGLDYVKQLSAWDSADVSKALAHHELDLDGNLRTIAEQKQRLFEAYLIRWKIKIKDSYTPKNEGVKQLLQQKLECAVGTLMAVWKSSKVPQNGP